MSSITDKLVESGHLSSEQVERVGKNVSEFMKEAKADPKFREEVLEKFGAPILKVPKTPSFLNWENMKSLLLGTAVLTGVGVATRGAESLIRGGVEAIKGSVNKGRYYKSMMDSNPQLADNDPQTIQKNFDTLYKFNPDYASDPTVAGQYVQQAITFEGMPLKAVNELVSARKSIVESKQKERLVQEPTRYMPPVSTFVPELPRAPSKKPGTQDTTGQNTEE